MGIKTKADVQDEEAALNLGVSGAARARRTIPSEARTEAFRRHGRAGGRPEGYSLGEETRPRLLAGAPREAWKRRKVEEPAEGGRE